MIIICKGLQVTLSVNGNVTEGDGNVTITATAGRAATDSVMISLSIESGTAGKFSCRYQTFHGILLFYFIVRDQDFTVVSDQFVIPKGERNVMVDIFNPGTDDFFETSEDFTITVQSEVTNGYLIIGNSLTINIQDDGQARQSEYPHNYNYAGARERIDMEVVG